MTGREQWTDAEVAAHLGISPSTVTSYEVDAPCTRADCTCDPDGPLDDEAPNDRP